MNRRKQVELEEARRAGLVAAEVDEDGNEINPHIPQYMSSAPWYLKSERQSLKHQRKQKSRAINTNSWYDRGAKTLQAYKFRKGACENCGAMTHNSKSCTERPRKVGVRWTNKHIAPDEKIELFEIDFEGKRDRSNGYDPASHALVIKSYEAVYDARRTYRRVQQLKKLDEKKSIPNGEGGDADEEDDDVDDMRVDEAKVDESKQMNFAKVEKRVCVTGGGSTGTVRNLRIREDTAKYLLNLDIHSAHYDPKSQSMRVDPLPDVDPDEKFYGGDNRLRSSGQASEFKLLNIRVWEAFEKGADIHMQAAPSQAERFYKNFKSIKEKLISQTKGAMLEKYGNAAAEDKLPLGLLLGQSEREVEYDLAGRIVKGYESPLPKSKYEEDVYLGNHSAIWGSWWNDHQWGYKCCWRTVQNSCCTSAAGIEASEVATNLMKANIALNRTNAVIKKNIRQWRSSRDASMGSRCP